MSNRPDGTARGQRRDCEKPNRSRARLSHHAGEGGWDQVVTPNLVSGGILAAHSGAWS